MCPLIEIFGSHACGTGSEKLLILGGKLNLTLPIENTWREDKKLAANPGFADAYSPTNHFAATWSHHYTGDNKNTDSASFSSDSVNRPVVKMDYYR